MKLYHVCPRWRLASILVEGLNPLVSPREVKRTWFCNTALLPWAVNHIAADKKVRPERLAIVEVNIRREDLVRHRKGIFWTAKHVNATDLLIGAMNAAKAVAKLGRYGYWRPS